MDNNSTDGSVDFVREKFRDIKIIENKENLGFSGGMNIGIKHTKGEFISLFSSDLIADKNWINELINVAISDEKIGVVGGKIYFWPDSKRIQFAGANIDLSPVYTQNVIGYGEFDNGEHDKISATDYIPGGVMLFKKKVIDKIGLLDPTFFMYFEETDFCLRAKKEGFEIIYVPRALVYHKEVYSPAYDGNQRKFYYLSRNVYILYFKHAKRYDLIVFLARKLMALLYETIKLMKKHKDIKTGFVYLKASLWWMLYLPLLIKKRRYPNVYL